MKNVPLQKAINIATMEAQMLLRDSEVFPSGKVLNDALGDGVYSILELFVKTIANDDYGLTIDWRFYNDGKAWFGKVIHKKKTVLWLSVWDGFFKTGFYFTEKHLEAIAALDISETIKQQFALAKPAGKLIPLIFDVNTSGQLPDLLTVVRFKMGLL